MVPDIANSFFAHFVAAVEAEADRRGLGVSLFATLNRPGRETTYLNLLERNHVDGLIFLTNHPDDGRLAALINGARRVVVVDEDVPGARAPRLFADNFAGGRLVGTHLGAAGHRRVIFLGQPDMLSGERRLAGLTAGLADHAAAPDVIVWHGAYTRDFGITAGRRFADGDRPATAIFSSADEITVGLMEVFRDRGVPVPGAVSLVGFDDIVPQHLFTPPVTAIRQPIATLGQRAVALLVESAWQEASGFPEEFVPVDLVVRGSVAPPAAA